MNDGLYGNSSIQLRVISTPKILFLIDLIMLLLQVLGKCPISSIVTGSELVGMRNPCTQ